MSRPQIIVTVTAALARRGAPTATGRALMVYAGAAGPTDPVVCTSAADATAAAVPAGVAAWVGDALAQGAPDVVIVRATAVDAGAVTEAEWAAGLAKLSSDYGPGQVLIPGVSTAAAHAALLDHADQTNRCVLLDLDDEVTASTAAAAASALAAAPGSDTAGMIAGWAVLPTSGGGTRTVPGSVVAAGLAGRGDAVAGHANNAPAGDQGRGAGYVTGSTGVTVAYTDAELDTLHDAGVSVIRNIRGTTQLYAWVSISSDPRFRQLNAGRMAMQLDSGIRAGSEAFLFRQIDGRGQLFAELEGFLRGYLQPLWASDALFGETAADAFDVDVRGVNSPSTITAGELHAAVEVTLTPHAEKVLIAVTTSTVEGA